jgi:hypothetical protein
LGILSSNSTISSMRISNFTRICIQIQVNKEISKSVLLDIGGKERGKVEVELSWKPPRYTRREMYGHTLAKCSKSNENVKKQQQQRRLKDERKKLAGEKHMEHLHNAKTSNGTKDTGTSPGKEMSNTGEAKENKDVGSHLPL